MAQPEDVVTMTVPEEELWENLKFPMILCLPG